MDTFKSPPSGSLRSVTDGNNQEGEGEGEGEVLEVGRLGGPSILEKLRRLDAWIEKKTHFESQGVERHVSMEQQRPPTIDVSAAFPKTIIQCLA